MGFLSGITSFVKEHSDVIHGVLDVAGFIPGVGAVADLANAGLYAAEGNWLDAGLSLASAVPGIGDTIALAKKTGKALKGLKGLKGFNALDKAKGMKSLFGALKGKAKTGASKVKGWLKNRKEALKNIKKRLKGECVNGRCFTGDTLVYTRHGYKTIKEIQKGDEVYSRNTETGETGFKEVEEVFCTTAHTIYHVWIDGKEEIKTTAYHPVYVEGQGWVTAINLREGDAIETMDGMACITKIVKERHEEPVPVYNFHVKDWASYFVGEVRIYVHNGPGHNGGNKADLGKKLDYQFGKAGGNKHNIDRTNGLKAEMDKLGFDDTLENRAYFEQYYNDILNDSSNIVGVPKTASYVENGVTHYYTITTRESFLMGKHGGAKVTTHWDGNRLLTIKIFSGKQTRYSH